ALSGDASKEADRLKARATAWSLTYFLAQKKLDGLQRYFKELSKMPRDLELTDEVLLGCFARAFDAVDANKRVDTGKLTNLANQWYSYSNDVPLEAEDLVKQIRKYYEEMAAQGPPAADTAPAPETPAKPTNPQPKDQGPKSPKP